MMPHIFRRVGYLFPKSLLKWAEQKLRFAGIIEDSVEWVGRRFLLSLMFALACVFFYVQFFTIVFDKTAAMMTLAVLFASFALLYILFYLELFFIVHSRTKTVEKVLPDFLLLIVSNLRAGLPPYSAFVHSAMPEFGPLYDGIKIATTRLGGKASINDALEEVSVHFDSPAFKRIASFFAKGSKAGGQIAKLIERSADEIRKIQDMRNELASSTRTYTIFLMFIVVLIMPFLLSVSTHFLTMFLTIQKATASSGGSVTGTLPVFGGEMKITSEQMIDISVITLVLTSLLVSLLLGVVLEGMPPYGLKYFPLIAVLSNIAFIFMRSMIQNMLSAFVG